MKKKLFIYIMIIALILSNFLITEAATVDESLDVSGILNQYANSINQKNENEYLSLFHQDYYEDSKTALDYYGGQERKTLPFYVMSEVQIQNYVEIPEKTLLEDPCLKEMLYNTGLEMYNLPADIQSKVIYFVHTAVVSKEDESPIALNGENLRVILLTCEKDVWKIKRITSAPPVQLLMANGIKLNSKIEMEDGKIITPDVNDQRAYVTQPYTIRVKCRYEGKFNGTTNYEYWSVGKNGVAEVPFADYIRDTLPNEWDSDYVVPDSSAPSTYKTEALRAGSILVRTFGWYMEQHPWDPNNNIHVNDDASQVYLHDSRTKTSEDHRGISFDWGNMCTDAFDSTPYAVLKINGWTPYFCQYNQVAQNYTYNNNNIGFEAIVDGVYTTLESEPYYNPSLYSQYDVFWFLNP